jgi:hypothetical protein
VTFYEWELPAARKAAARLKVRLNPVPLMLVYDLKSKTSIIINYTLKEQKCPFYGKIKNRTGCMIYNERPLECRAFPAPAGLAWFLKGELALCPKQCPAELPAGELAVEFGSSAKPPVFMKNLIERYGKTHTSQCCADLLFRAEMDFLTAKEVEGKIRLERAVVPPEKLAAAVRKSGKTTLSRFYARLGFAKERSEMLKNCTDLSQVSEAARAVTGE